MGVLFFLFFASWGMFTSMLVLGGMASVHIFHLWLIFWEDLHDDDHSILFFMVFIFCASWGETSEWFLSGGDDLVR